MAHRGAFFDMNGTLTRGEPGFEFLIVLHELGRCSDADFARVQEAIERFRRRELSNEAVADAMFQTMSTAIKGLPVREAMAAYEARYRERLRPAIFPYAHPLVSMLRELGCATFAVTNVAHPLLEPLLADLGIERGLAPALEQDAGRFTGRVLDLDGARASKGEAVRRAAARAEIDLAASFAFGDGEGDASFLALVGHPVAVRPTPPLAAIAQARGWPILRNVNSVDEVAGILGIG